MLNTLHVYIKTIYKCTCILYVLITKQPTHCIFCKTVTFKMTVLNNNNNNLFNTFIIIEYAVQDNTD